MCCTENGWRMKGDILAKKRKLLQRMSAREYRELLGYIRKVYLADYDLKILMARKCSNLFLAMLPLAREEYGGQVEYLYEELLQKRKSEKLEEPVIISNRALEMLKEDIQKGKYQRILLADDIIIHGRTLIAIHDLLKSWLSEVRKDCEIKVYAYAENVDGILEDKDFLKERDVNLRCTTSQWRAISNEIVNVFYLLGHPYTSYVPNSMIHMQSELGSAIKKIVQSHNFICREKIGKNPGFAKCYVYAVQSGSKIELSRSVRIYEYTDLNEYVLVPMVMIKPIEKENLQDQMSRLSEWIDEAYWQKLKGLSEKDIFYQTAVYIISAFWGWQFVEEKLKLSMHNLQYDTQEEKVNFGSPIFKPEAVGVLNKESVCQILADLNVCYKEQPELQSILEGNVDISEKFGEDFKDLNDEFGKNLEIFVENGYAGDSSHMKEILGRYLHCNGDLDERRCRDTHKASNKNYETRDESRRLIGYPMEKLKAELERQRLKWMEAVLAAIDLGKGSIVPKVLNYNGNVYFLSVIHAGEQNYKYFEETYFPFLYGLYQIECEAAKTDEQKGKEKHTEWKEKFLQAYECFWNSEKRFILEEDIAKISEMNMTEEFQEVLVRNAWDYFDDPIFNKAIEVAKKITDAEEVDVKKI